MHFIGTALVVLGFVDFGLYLLGNVSTVQLSFIPQVLVFGDKDFTGVAVVMIGYFLREAGGGEEPATTADSTPDDTPEPAAPVSEQAIPSNAVNAGGQRTVASWGFIDSWLRNSFLGTLFAAISGSQDWFNESPGLRFFGRLFIVLVLGLLVIGIFASFSEA